jgi:mycothiol synthase
VTIQTAFKDRAYTDDDLQAVTDLLNLCDAVDKQDDSYTAEDLRTEFEEPTFNKQKDLRLWEDAQGKLVGFGQLWLRSAGDEAVLDGGSYIRIHPEVRNQGIEDAIMDWMIARTKEAGVERGLPARLRGGAREDFGYMRAIYERYGMEVVRYFFTMVRDLEQPMPEPQFPQGFMLRQSRGLEDAPGWVEMFNQSFVDHWNFHPMEAESHAHWLSDAKYNSERDLIAVAPDSTFAAFCFCWIDPDDNERNNRKEGWIDMLGTRRGFRKIGLGRAMLLAGMHRLKAEGMDTAKLGVDAENPTGALGLYESVGFVVRNTMVVYRKNL